MSTIYDQLTHHLARHEHVTHVQTGQVTIGRQTYPAARYTEELETAKGCQAYDRGERTYTREMIYCVGMLPNAFLRGHVAFTVAYDSREWYVAGYYGDIIARKQSTKEPNEFHPFGNSFILAPWSLTDGKKIDYYARVPYRRVKAVLGELWITRKPV